MKIHLNGCDALREEIERVVGLGKLRAKMVVELAGQRLSSDGPEVEMYTNVEDEVFNFFLDPEYDVIFLQPQQDLSLLIALFVDQFRELADDGAFDILYTEDAPVRVEVIS